MGKGRSPVPGAGNLLVFGIGAVSFAALTGTFIYLVRLIPPQYFWVSVGSSFIAGVVIIKTATTIKNYGDLRWIFGVSLIGASVILTCGKGLSALWNH
jgi:hypothetical protein